MKPSVFACVAALLDAVSLLVGASAIAMNGNNGNDNPLAILSPMMTSTADSGSQMEVQCDISAFWDQAAALSGAIYKMVRV
jgi:hypothetical protein